jgi:hypothetical protein
MINNYCIDIKLPVEHPLENPTILNQSDYKPDIFFVDHSDVSEKFTQWLDSQGLVMTYPPLIFYTPPHRECGFHIDGNAITDRAVINWIVGGEGSLMHWYNLAPDAEITEMTNTQAGTPYTRYTEEQVVHAHTQAVKWPSIVQTGVPHKVTNYGNEHRWCISCDISKKESPEAGLTMVEASEIFKKWIL